MECGGSVRSLKSLEVGKSEVAHANADKLVISLKIPSFSFLICLHCIKSDLSNVHLQGDDPHL
jgi:hypothetical protein